MTPTVFKQLLTDANVSFTNKESQFCQIPFLQSINMTTYGNHVINYHKDFIKFDFENQLIFIKEKEPKMVSGRFSNDYAVSNLKLTFPNYYTMCLKNKKYPFNKLKEGDTIFSNNNETAIIEKIEIDEYNKCILTLSKNIIIKDYIGYIDTEIYNNGAVRDPFDNSLFFTYKNISDNLYDWYLDMNYAMSISFDSEYMGNR